MSSGQVICSLVKPNIAFYSIIVKSSQEGAVWDGLTLIYGAKHEIDGVNHDIDEANHVK